MLPDHLHNALVLELKRAEHAALDKDAAFAFLARPGNTASCLGTYQFWTRDRWEATPEKRRPSRLVIVPDAIASDPLGIRGFPNKLRREWFDRAWVEARV